MSLKLDIDQLVADTAIVHAIAQGPAALVNTEGGPVKSLALAIADIQIAAIASAAGAAKWVSGTSYAEGDCAWSPINFLSYRRKIAGGGTTDPANDTTNWASIGSSTYGSVALNGADGVTITHNRGDTKYLLNITPTGSAPGDVGEISYAKAANTCTIYNTGRPRIAADYELSTTP